MKKQEDKIHLRNPGLSYRCGVDYFAPNTRSARKYSEVTCLKCMKSEPYKNYLEGKLKEKPPTFEADCASGYYQTGKRVRWLHAVVKEFNPITAKELVDKMNHASLPYDEKEKVPITQEAYLEVISNTWALLAINKELTEQLIKLKRRIRKKNKTAKNSKNSTRHFCDC